ncbi:rhomboid family intramembrane serine protease [Chitinophaga sp. SYP-B3965]|nr:rhomboid family intramembrane serine protease [Chitinophaga sp. SYP-B3965]
MICGLGAALCHMGVLTYENMQVVKDAQHFYAHPSFDTYNTFFQEYPSLKNYTLKEGNTELPMQSFVDGWRNLPPESYDMIFRAKLYVSKFIQDFANVPTVGASGAVFGILFAFGYLFPNNYLFILPIPFPIKAKYFIGGYILLELYLGIKSAGDDNVAHWAHLGGALFGYLLLKFWNKRNRRTLY